MPEASILLVDDDDIDAKSLRRAIEKLDGRHAIFRASDGEEALHMLRGTGGRDRLEGPLVMTLDLNMPRMTGHECLEALRADRDLDSTVVFVVSTSDNEDDRRMAYAHHPAGYVVKGVDAQAYSSFAELLVKYIEVVMLP